ncbi:MAG: hypothetical protein JXA18_13410 [Chitinispirillaceae bacterium]|nr:hypothetical protein [Chitinispirillaceae bacterium]
MWSELSFINHCAATNLHSAPWTEKHCFIPVEGTLLLAVGRKLRDAANPGIILSADGKKYTAAAFRSKSWEHFVDVSC